MANATRFIVYVKYNETDKAIRRFKKMTLESGIIKEYYNRKAYQKPSDKKRIEKQKSIARREREINKQLKKYIKYY
jgi:small subunit ribosomal protein S21